METKSNLLERIAFAQTVLNLRIKWTSEMDFSENFGQNGLGFYDSCSLNIEHGKFHQKYSKMVEINTKFRVVPSNVTFPIILTVS